MSLYTFKAFLYFLTYIASEIKITYIASKIDLVHIVCIKYFNSNIYVNISYENLFE